MKIFDVLKKIEEQKKYYEKRGMLAEASAMETTSKKLKEHINKEILSKKEASQAWANTDSDVSEYLNKIIELVAQLTSLPKEEIEEDYDVDKIKKIYYLIHNTNRRLLKVTDGFASSAISNEGKNSDLYKFLRDYIQFAKPESLSEFEAFYYTGKNSKGKKEFVNKIPVEAFVSAANEGKMIPNFAQWLHDRVNGTLSVATIEELASFKGGGKGPNRGNYEMLLGMLVKDSQPSSGKGGDLKLGNYGAELKASSTAGVGGFGKIGGQQTSFVKDPAPIISTVQNAVKTFFDKVISIVPEHLKSNSEIAALIQKFGNKSKLQFSVDATWNASSGGVGNGGTSEAWEAQTVDSAVISILTTIDAVLSQDENSVKAKATLGAEAPGYIKDLLVTIWSMWNPSKSKAIVKQIVDFYFDPNFDAILSGKNFVDHKPTVRAKKTFKVNTLLSNFNLFKKAIAFTLLQVYSNEEKFDFIILINSANGGKCFVLSKDSIKAELQALMTGSDILPDVAYSTPATYGNPGGQGVQWGIGLA